VGSPCVDGPADEGVGWVYFRFGVRRGEGEIVVVVAIVVVVSVLVAGVHVKVNAVE
jgi:hypothetical protein